MTFPRLSQATDCQRRERLWSAPKVWASDLPVAGAPPSNRPLRILLTLSGSYAF